MEERIRERGKEGGEEKKIKKLEAGRREPLLCDWLIVELWSKASCNVQRLSSLEGAG